MASLLKNLEAALDRAEVANREKSNFLATMSHEIRTPLNGLIGVLDLLDMTDLKSRQQHFVDLMKSSSTWLMNVISEGLDFTKIEANELIIEPVVTDIRAVISDITAIFSQVAPTKGLSFESDPSEWHESLHDLRNALGGVVGGVELALLGSDDHERCRAQLEMALESAQRAVSIASFLQSSRGK